MDNSKLLNRYYDLLKCQANKSNIKIKLAACILQGKKMICKPCCNIERNYYKRNLIGSLHAEAHVIMSYYKKHLIYDKNRNKWNFVIDEQKSNKNFDLIVIRINKSNELGNSRPCYNCLNILQTVGIKKVYYTTGNGDELVYEYVKNMVSIESSSINIIYDTIEYNINKKLYFKNLLKNLFPKKIKYENLLYFIKYNYNNLCFNYKYNYNLLKTSLIYQVIFYDENNNIITSAFIV